MPQLKDSPLDTALDNAFNLGLKGAIGIAELCDNKHEIIARLEKWLKEREDGATN